MSSPESIRQDAASDVAAQSVRIWKLNMGRLRRAKSGPPEDPPECLCPTCGAEGECAHDS